MFHLRADGGAETDRGEAGHEVTRAVLHHGVECRRGSRVAVTQNAKEAPMPAPWRPTDGVSLSEPAFGIAAGAGPVASR